MPADTKRKRQRFSLSFAASVLTHVLLALLVTLNHTKTPLPKPKLPEQLDVVLLNPEVKSSPTPPEKTDAISNRTVKGGNTSAKDKTARRARSPLAGVKRKPLPTPPRMPSRPQPVPPPTPEKRTRTLARRGMRLEPEADTMPRKQPRKKHKRKLPNVPLANLMPSSMALAQLSREADRERRLKSLLSREDDVPINTREAKYAPYARQLVAALEEQWRPGQANYSQYPEEERRSLMRITIERNGELSRVEILRPSPIHRLNETAVAAIHAAAPFRPLPSAWGLDRVNFYLTFEVIEDRFVFHSL